MVSSSNLITSGDSIFNEFKRELLLGKNVFNEQDSLLDKPALAQNIQNLLFIEKGTYPNQPNLGIGIQNYQFEFLDVTTINHLNDVIKDNIDNFIETNHIINVDTQSLDSAYGKVLALYFLISGALGNTGEKEEFLIVIGTNSDKKTISKIIV